MIKGGVNDIDKSVGLAKEFVIEWYCIELLQGLLFCGIPLFLH